MAIMIPTSVSVFDDAAVLALQRSNPAWRLELSADGVVIASPLTGTATGPKEGEAFLQLAAWSRAAGGKAFPASTGFRLPDKSVRGPDAAWISTERLSRLEASAKRSAFWSVCPDVVIEIMSEWDTWAELRDKIDLYARNGASYAVAVDCGIPNRYERGVAPPGLQLDFAAICAA